MALKVGEIVEGKISGITGFGAFVDLGDHKTGLVHISEVSDGFIKDIHDVLTVGDTVKVKVTKIGDDGKIGLSIRKTKEPADKQEHKSSKHVKKFAKNNKPVSHHTETKEEHFDNLLSNFMKESESRMSVIKKNTEGKRGGRGGRRS